MIDILELQVATNYIDMYRNIQKELKLYLRKSNLKSLVLGVSGGIDSALCAALALPICDKLGIPLIGASLPMNGNKDEEKYRALAVGKHLCTEFKELSLADMYGPVVEHCNIFIDDTFEDETAQKIRLGNIKARLRMIYLYNLAQFNKGMVLSTDNYTEYLLGFWTLHGDVGDYGMIQTLWKTEVYGLAKWIAGTQLTDPEAKKALLDCVEAVPTDGLGITNSDLDQLGCKSYDEVDRCLLDMFIASDRPLTEEYVNIMRRHQNSKFKRLNPINIKRSTIIDDGSLPF